jgi:23S rRNA (adenine2030-N6)-methyltransferase
MNYRHIYHAGNFADVFKHIVLMRVIAYLKQKDKPFFALDTHAGTGRYNLTSVQAQKTMEAAAGIGSLWGKTDLPPAIGDYLALVKRFNPESPALSHYPGSPLIMKALLRGADRLVANELHPEDAHMLRKALGTDTRVKVENMDGYTCLKAFLPPDERRGVVLIDPPFEVTDEFARMTKGLHNAYTRWATGIYALWYPIKSPAEIHLFHHDVKALNIPRCTAFDFMLRQSVDAEILNGCGMLLVNAPWVLGDEIRTIAPALIQHMTGGAGTLRVNEITGETA